MLVNGGVSMVWRGIEKRAQNAPTRIRKRDKKRGPKRPLGPQAPGRLRSLLGLLGPAHHPKATSGVTVGPAAPHCQSQGHVLVEAYPSPWQSSGRGPGRTLDQRFRLGRFGARRAHLGRDASYCRRPDVSYGPMVVLRADPWNPDYGMGF